MVEKIDDALVLAEQISSLKEHGGDLPSQLTVDDRVLARITDGIYRRPSAALRELIFNAYDADATEVVIDTDAPRFEYISVRDNGRGMDEKSLANLFKHIGGSSKRTHKGIELGTVHSDNPDLTPMGRKLIGKIGIGMFAVTHLTTHFRVITKKKNQTHRLIAEVWMKTWTEENLRNAPEDDGEFITGDVVFSVEPASDPESHGTEIVLLEIRDQTRNNLKSADFWENYLETRDATDPIDKKTERSPPQFHIGYVRKEDDEFTIAPQMPWNDTDEDLVKFKKLYEQVVAGTGTTTKNPDIEEYLDTYLGMIWLLSLAAPLKYIDSNPLLFSSEKKIDFYKIQNRAKSQATPLILEKDQTLTEAMDLESNAEDPCGGFTVVVDGIELKRPVILPDTLLGNRKKVRATNPMMFVGKVKTSLGTIPADRGGGGLEFEAYFYWNSLIVPKQNRGVLVRINNASGVLYDDRFMEYQISELNRLSQITAEIFIMRGLDPALNIDRESFNVSHPHYQYLTKWVHAALRQVTNKLKDVGKKSRDEEKTSVRATALTAVESHLNSVWERKGDSLTNRPDVVILPSSNTADLIDQNKIAYQDAELTFSLDKERLAILSKPSTQAPLTTIEQAKAVMVVLSAYSLLDDIAYSRQQDLFMDIVNALSPELNND